MKVLKIIVVTSCFVLFGCSNNTLQQQNDELNQRVFELEAKLGEFENDAEVLYQEAIEERDNGDYDEAIAKLNEIKDQFPNSEIIEKVEDEIVNINNLISNGDNEELKLFQAAVKKAEEQDSPSGSIIVLNDFIKNSSNSELNRKAREIIKTYKVVEEKKPLEILSADVTYNSIGTPLAWVKVKNVSGDLIDAYELVILTFDNYNRPVKHYLNDTNIFKAISQEYVGMDETFGDDIYWTLYGHDNTTKIKALLKSVHFIGDKTWENPSILDEIREEQDSY